MVGQICVRYDYFVLFIVVAVAIIIWVLHQVNETTEKAKHKLKKLYQAIEEKQKQEQEQEKIKQNETALDTARVESQRREEIDERYQVRQDRGTLPYPIYNDPRYGEYQLVGYVYPHKHPDQMFRLMGRQYNSTRYEYYVIHPYTDIKIPIKVKNDWELNHGDRVDIPGFKGHYLVNIYDMDRVIF
jgi:Sec-independent protein translocase protein TatA